MISKYPQDFLDDIRNMLAEELSVQNVADYLGAPYWLVRYIKNPASFRRATKKYFAANREDQLKKMKEYQRKYWLSKRHESKNKPPVDNPFAS